MRSLLLLSGVFGLVVVVGCASGSTTTSSGGAAGGTSTESTSTTASTSTTSVTDTTSASTTTSSTTTSQATGGGGSGGGMGGSGGMMPVGFPLGSDCNTDADCESNLCKPVVVGIGNSVCVKPCTQQSDCGAGASFFCEAVTAGATDGYCIPHSPAHCLSCASDTDCGSLSETCFQAPGDINKACHVDCAIAGDSACPSDYACTDQTVNGQARRLCRPKVIPTCLDAIGGFCDRLVLPQPCLRVNAAGTCLGERTCIPGAKRFDKCSALAPQCKTDCSVQDPAGCMEIYCAGATNTVTNCGSCGNVCPGNMAPFGDASCQAGGTCSFTCQGEHYDVNGDPANGCEVLDPTTGNHTVGAGVSLGNISCDDDPPFGSPKQTVKVTSDAFMVSDARGHVPAIAAFSATTGSSPDWYHINATGGTFCVNDIGMTLQMVNSAFPTCYKMTIITNQGTYPCTTGANGACSISKGSGSYSDGTSVDIKVEKTCDTTMLESVAYTVIGHL